MPIMRPAPQGQLARAQLAFLTELDHRRQDIGAERIIGFMRLTGTVHVVAGNGRRLALPIYAVDYAIIAAGWTYVLCGN